MGVTVVWALTWADRANGGTEDACCADWVLSSRTRRLRLPPPTVRLRLTLLYGLLFLCCGVGLLAITYLLADHATSRAFTYTYKSPNGKTTISCGTITRLGGGYDGLLIPGTKAGSSQVGQCDVLAVQAHAHVMHQLLAYSGIALAIMALAAAVLGWLVGRAGAAAAAEHHHRHAGHHRAQPARAAGAARAGRRSQGPRRHHRRPARPAGRSIRGTAAVHGQRLPRTAHTADDDAHLARCRHRKARTSGAGGVTARGQGTQGAGQGRPAGGELPGPGSRSAGGRVARRHGVARRGCRSSAGQTRPGHRGHAGSPWSKTWQMPRSGGPRCCSTG